MNIEKPLDDDEFDRVMKYWRDRHLKVPTANVLEIAGLILMVIGVGMIYIPAAPILAGIGLLIASMGAANDIPDERDS